MPPSNDVEENILRIVRQFGSGRTIPASELYHDLHIHGDDAGEMLEEIQQRYGTSFAGFNFTAYFPNETEALPRIVKRLGFRDKAVGSFTVAHLIAVVRAGQWFAPT